MSWLNGAPSAAPRSPGGQEDENTASDREGPLLLSHSHPRKHLRFRQESNVLVLPSLWGLAHLLQEGGGADESKLLVLNEAFSVEELTKRRNWERGAETAKQSKRSSEEKQFNGKEIRVYMKSISGEEG